MAINYQNLLNSQSSIISEDFIDELEIIKIFNEKLDKYADAYERITDKKAINLFYFDSLGRLIGLLQSVLYNRKHWDKLFKEIPLTSEQMVMFQMLNGNFAYISNGKLYPTKTMDVTRMRKLIPVIANKLGIYIPENMYACFTQERWNTIATSIEEEVMKTIKLKDSALVNYKYEE